MDAFKKGDIVVVSNERLGEFYGQRGVIREQSRLTESVGVFLDSGRLVYFEITSLEKV